MRHWQHHPISLPPVSKLRLEQSSTTAVGASSSCKNRRFVTPVVLSKVQHFLESSSAAASLGIPHITSPITATEGMRQVVRLTHFVLLESQSEFYNLVCRFPCSQSVESVYGLPLAALLSTIHLEQAAATWLDAPCKQCVLSKRTAHLVLRSLP